MTKHFCDKCGQECPPDLMYDISCEPRSFGMMGDDEGNGFNFEVCSVCMLKLRKLMEEKENRYEYDIQYNQIK